MSDPAAELHVVVVSGPDDPKRSLLGLSMAAAAVATGSAVSVYLVMDGAQWLREEHCQSAPLAGYPAVVELMDAIREGGGAIEFCQHCVEDRCRHTNGGDQPSCGCASAAGIAAYGVGMTTTPTVVF